MRFWCAVETGPDGDAAFAEDLSRFVRREAIERCRDDADTLLWHDGMDKIVMRQEREQAFACLSFAHKERVNPLALDVAERCTETRSRKHVAAARFVAQRSDAWHIGICRINAGAAIEERPQADALAKHDARYAERAEECLESCEDGSISLCRNERECADALSMALYNVSRILAPHAMILDFDLPYSCDEVIPLLEDNLRIKYRLSADDKPELRRAYCKMFNAHRGLTMGLRELWLDRIVFGVREGS